MVSRQMRKKATPAAFDCWVTGTAPFKTKYHPVTDCSGSIKKIKMETVVQCRFNQKDTF
jgi:hypothetical protein